MPSVSDPADQSTILDLVDYLPPSSPAQVMLDIVTPTRNRRQAIRDQAQHLSAVLTPNDRWVIVDDASDDTISAADDVLPWIDKNQVTIAWLSYVRGLQPSVTRARSCACALVRPGAWIVELDDHDPPTPEGLAHVREAICRGAVFVYGHCTYQTEDGAVTGLYSKPNYRPWQFQDEACYAEGMRAFPLWLYQATGGYRWDGPIATVNGNEFPAEDYGLFLRMEQLTKGQAFYRIPHSLCMVTKCGSSTSSLHQALQARTAADLRQAARAGMLRT